MEESHQRFITVPKNDAGRQEYFSPTLESENVIYHRLPENEFLSIYRSGFLWKMNEKFGLMLDDYEAGDISTDLEFVLAEAEAIKETCPTLYEAAQQACEYKTEICFAL